jgi:nitrile hydratase accessory protein
VSEVSDGNRRIADLDGLPRNNGELVFEAPWQSRAFGIVVALNQLGAFAWPEFRPCLVDEIAGAGEREYYASWLSAIERLVLEQRLLTPDELSRRTSEFAALDRDEVF